MKLFKNVGIEDLDKIIVEAENAKQNEFEEIDINKEMYEEYIVDEVRAENIKKIYIPEIFKRRL